MRHVRPSRQAKECAIGGLAMVVMAVALALSYKGAEMTDVADRGGYHVVADFDWVDGLVENDPVYLSGVEVGRVLSLTLTPDYRVSAMLHMTSDIPVPADTSAAIHTDGLFGSKFITLEVGGSDKILSEGDRIHYTQRAIIVSDLLGLIIAQGRSVRADQEAQ